MKDDDRPGSGDLGWHFQFGQPKLHLREWNPDLGWSELGHLLLFRTRLLDQPDLDDQLQPETPPFVLPPVSPPAPAPITLDQVEPLPSSEPLEDLGS